MGISGNPSQKKNNPSIKRLNVPNVYLEILALLMQNAAEN